MARQTQQRTTRRVAVEDTRGGSRAFNDVHARIHGTRAYSDAEYTAQALQEALGIALPVVSEIAAQRDAQLEFEGANDARAGRVDPEKMRKAAYARGANLVQVEADAVRDADEITQLAEPFITDGDVDGLRAMLEREYERRWAGRSREEITAIAPRWMKLRADLETRLRDTAVETTRANDEANFSTLVGDAIKRYNQTGEPFDYAGFDARARELFGTQANDVIARVYSAQMEAHNAPWLYDLMPDTWEDGVATIKTHPKFADGFKGAADKAASALEAGLAAERELMKAEALRHVDHRIQSGNWLSDRELREGTELGFWSAEKESELRRRQFSEQEARRRQQKLTIDLWSSFDDGTHHQYANIVSAAEKQDQFDAWMRARTAGMDDASTLRFQIEAAARNGLVYSPLQSELSNPNFADSERLKDQLDKFRAAYQISPATARRHVSNDQTVDLYLSLQTLQDIGLDPVQRLSSVNLADAEARRTRWETGLRNEVLDKLGSLELDRPGALFFNRPDLKNIANQSFLRAEAERIADQLGRSGLFDSADAVLKTLEKVLQTRYVVLGDRVVPRQADMPDDMEEAVEWFHERRLGELLRDTGVSAKQVELRADGRTATDRKTFGLYYKGTLATVVPQRFTLDGIYDEYRNFVLAEQTRPQREHWDWFMRQVVETGKLADPSKHVERYAEDRKALSVETRASLDRIFHEPAKARLQEETETLRHLQQMHTRMEGVTNTPFFIQSRIREQQAVVDRWRAFVIATQPD